MLTDSQRRAATRALEEFIGATTGDPMRIELPHLDNLQTILAGVGLLILPKSHEHLPEPVIVPPALAAALMPHGALPPAHVQMSARQLAPAPTGASQPRRLTENERGIVNTLAMAAEDMRHKPGYTMRAGQVLDLIRITRAVSGETTTR